MDDLDKSLEKIHEGAPSLPLEPTQQQFDDWFGHYFRQTREATGDASSPFYRVDLNDAVMNFLTVRYLAHRHPELRTKAAEDGAMDRIVRNAMGPGGGMAGGAMFIARELGSDHDETMKIMFHDIFADQESRG